MKFDNTLLSLTHLTNSCQNFKTVKEEQLATLESNPYVSVTSDIWSSCHKSLHVHHSMSILLQTQGKWETRSSNSWNTWASYWWALSRYDYLSLVNNVRDNATNMVLVWLGWHTKLHSYHIVSCGSRVGLTRTYNH